MPDPANGPVCAHCAWHFVDTGDEVRRCVSSGHGKAEIDFAVFREALRGDRGGLGLLPRRVKHGDDTPTSADLDRWLS